MLSNAKGNEPMVERLRDSIIAQGTRIIDLLHRWDKDHDGQISKAEFRKALRNYGCPATTIELNTLFDKWDTDKYASPRTHAQQYPICPILHCNAPLPHSAHCNALHSLTPLRAFVYCAVLLLFAGRASSLCSSFTRSSRTTSQQKGRHNATHDLHTHQAAPRHRRISRETRSHRTRSKRSLHAHYNAS